MRMGRRMCRIAPLRVCFRVGLFLFFIFIFLFLFVFRYLTSADGRQEDEMIVSGTKIFPSHTIIIFWSISGRVPQMKISSSKIRVVVRAFILEILREEGRGAVLNCRW